jgi:hypothetical protein
LDGPGLRGVVEDEVVEIGGRVREGLLFFGGETAGKTDRCEQAAEVVEVGGGRDDRSDLEFGSGGADGEWGVGDVGAVDEEVDVTTPASKVAGDPGDVTTPASKLAGDPGGVGAFGEDCE